MGVRRRQIERSHCILIGHESGDEDIVERKEADVGSGGGDGGRRLHRKRVQKTREEGGIDRERIVQVRHVPFRRGISAWG